MDHEGEPNDQSEATPIFGAYRRGYDPDQVDRYVAEQQRRLDEAMEKISDAERRRAGAVGQLRELQRRVAMLEGEERSPQAPPLDTLGERVQRILQEAWEGAYALRQNAEQEATELRERVAGEAQGILASARRKAQMIDEEIERRRRGYLQKLEEDRSRAVSQIDHLHEKRQAALDELLRVKDMIEETVAGVAPLRRDERTFEERPPISDEPSILDDLAPPALRLHTEEEAEIDVEAAIADGTPEIETDVQPTDDGPEPRGAAQFPSGNRRRSAADHAGAPSAHDSLSSERAGPIRTRSEPSRASVNTRAPQSSGNRRPMTSPNMQSHASVFDFDAE